jgi:hypothetical protein
MMGSCHVLYALINALAFAGSESVGPSDQVTPGALKRLTLEELSQIEVTSLSKEPKPAFRVPMAIYVRTA